MSPEAGSMVQIGSVVNMKGQVFADHGDGVRPLSVGSPINQNDVILTKAGANVEIKFLDDTVMSQGENSNLRLDTYVYEPSTGGNLLFNMAEGTFRVVTGKIADSNPENFKLKSPLATIGIRGTTVVSEIRGGVEKHGAEEIHSGKALTIQNALGQVQLVTNSRGMVDFRPDGSMGAPRPFSVQEVQHFQSVTPIRSVPTITAPPPPPASGGQQGGQPQGGQQQGGQQQGQQGGQEGQQGQQGQQGQGAGTGAGTGTGEGAVIGTGAGVDGGLIGGVFGGGAGGLGPSSLLAGGINGEGGGLKITVAKSAGQGAGDGGGQQITGPAVPVIQLVVKTNENVVSTTTTSVVNDESDKQKEQQQQQQQQNTSPGNDGNDHTEASSAGVYLTATTAGETLVGTAYDDILMGMGGRNWLESHGGSDILIGGSYNGLTMQGDIASFAGLTTGVYASLADGMAWVDGKATALVNIMGLRGGDGNDTLIGDWTSNYLEGGRGDDTLVGAPNAASDYGDDVASYMHAADGVTVSLSVGTLGAGNSLDLPASTPIGTSTGADGQDTLVFIENVIGSDYDDTLIGNAKENWFQGRGGADSIVGSDGILSGGGQAIDTLSYEDQSAGVTVDLAAQTMSGGDAVDIFSGIEGVDGSDFADTLIGNTDIVAHIGGQDVTLYGSNWFMGHGGDDVIDGGGHGLGGRDVAGYSHAPSAVSVNLDAGVLSQALAGHAVGDTYGGSSGGDGDDTLFGIDGVEGSGYADTLVGSDDGNWFQGNTGNDTIIGGLKADTDVDMASYDDATAGVTVDLNAGIIATGGSGYLGTAEYEDFHWHGTATPLVADGSLLGTSTGGDGQDILVNIEGVSGSDYADNINGNAQSNVLYGHGGNDTLFGGAGGYDLIRGGLGNDLIVMGSAMDAGDVIEGGDGMDTLYLEDSNPGTQDGQLAHVSTVESIVVTGGTAELSATPGLVAAGGGLVVYAANLDPGASFTWDGHELGSDIGIAVTGSDGGDTLTAGQGTDTLSGGAGNDTFLFGSNLDYTTGTTGTDSVDGGADQDTLAYTDVDSSSFTGELDGVSHVETIVINGTGAYVRPMNDLAPSSGGVTINAAALSGGLHFDGSHQTANLTVLGGAFADTVQGGYGADTISTGQGNDLVSGSKGNDSLNGGPGDDTLDFSGFSHSLHLTMSTSASGYLTIDGGYGAQNFTGFETIVGSGLDDHFQGSADGDALFAGAGEDSISGGAGGDDSIDAGAGDDLLNMGGQLTSGDTIDGGDGDDTLVYEDSTGGGGELDHVTNVEVIELVNASATITAASTLVEDDASILIDGSGIGNHSLSWDGSALGAATTVVVKGSDEYDVGDTMVGGAGANTFHGYGGNDRFTLGPGSGEAALYGGTGADSFFLDATTGSVTADGGDGADAFTLMSGSGAVSLIGGEGADSFLLGALTGGVELDAGAGDDNVTATLADNDIRTRFYSQSLDSSWVLDGGDDNDTLFLSHGNSDVTLDLTDNGPSLSGFETILVTNAVANVAILAGSGAQGLSGVTLDARALVNGRLLLDASAETTGGLSVWGGVLDDSIMGGQSGNVIDGYGGNDRIMGGAEDDTLYGGAGNDSLQGLDGTDTLYGGDGNDILSGGEGTDSLSSGIGDDTLSGDAGSDRIEMLGDGFVDGGDDDDDIFLGGGDVTATGGNGNDAFTSGTGGAKTLLGSEGNDDYAMAGAGTAVLDYGASGLDGVTVTMTGAASGGVEKGTAGEDSFLGVAHFAGTAGDDTFQALFSNLTFDGGAGVDTLDYSGIDQGGTLTLSAGVVAESMTSTSQYFLHMEAIRGTDHYDTITGTASNLTILGGLGDDTISLNGVGNWVDYSYRGGYSYLELDLGVTIAGGYSVATVGGGEVADTDQVKGVDNVRGTIGNDDITGDADNNVLEGGLGGDVLDGAGGVNTVSYAHASTGVTVDLDSGLTLAEDVGSHLAGESYGTAWGGDGNDYLFGFANIVGSAGDDTLTGNNGNNAIWSGGGDDSISAEDGNDLVSLGVYTQGSQAIDGGIGLDALAFTSDGASTYDLANVSHFETITLGDASTHISLTSATTGPLTINAMALGSGHSLDFDGVEATAATLQVWGGNGNDSFLVGGSGDTYDGGDGIDLLDYQHAGQGINLVLSGTNMVAEGNLHDHLVNFESFRGSEFSDTIVGNHLANTIEGGAGDDSLSGGSDGVDTLSYEHASGAVQVDLWAYTATGAAGNDSLDHFDNVIGSDYNDYILADGEVLGGGGDDTLVAAAECVVTFSGQDGYDTLFGGRYSENVLDGGAENDTLYGQTSGEEAESRSKGDTLLGGDGDDLIIMADNMHFLHVVDGGADFDTLTMTAEVAFSDTVLGQVSGIETLVLEAQGASGTIRFDPADSLVEAGATLAVDASGMDSAYSLDWRGHAETDGSFFVTGGAGDDTFIGGEADDSFYGGAGTDTADYHLSAAAVHVDLTPGSCGSPRNPSATGAFIGTDSLGGVERFIGSAYDDSFLGDWQDQTFLGGLGDDTMDGASGSDWVDYSATSNGVTLTLDGGNSVTAVIEGGERDTLSNIENLRGSAVEDILTGDGEDNSFEGGTGNDILDGAGGVDTVSYAHAVNLGVTVSLSAGTLASAVGEHSAGDPYGTASGGDDADYLFNFENIIGSDQADTLVGSAQNNVIEGGAGDDSLSGGSGGVDTVSYAGASAGVQVSLLDGSSTGGAGVDILDHFQNIIGSAYADMLMGDDNNNTILGGLGNDFIEGGLGDDSMVGGGGLDTLGFRSATDWVYVNLGNINAQITHGAGEDTYSGFSNLWGGDHGNTLIGDSGDNTIEGGAGDDVLSGSGGLDTVSYEHASAHDDSLGVTVDLSDSGPQDTGGAGHDQILDFVNLIGSEFNDDLTGSEYGNTILSGAGDDTIHGGLGNDVLHAGLGTDWVYGEDGDDTITVFGDGDDHVYAGGGHDTVHFSVDLDSNDTVDGGEGTDTLTMSDGESGDLDHVSGFEFLILADSDHTLDPPVDLVGVGTTFTVDASALGENHSLVWDGSDVSNGQFAITGGHGYDSIIGGAGNDIIHGGDGNDTILGGQGQDALTGGAGHDIFIYGNTAQGGAGEHITDFTHAEDKLTFDGVSFGVFGDVASHFSSKAAYDAGNLTSDPYFIYDQSSGTLFYDDNAATPGDATAIVTLDTKPALAATDLNVFAP